MNKQISERILLEPAAREEDRFDLFLPLCCGVIVYGAARMTGHPLPLVPAVTAMLSGIFGTRRWYVPAALGSMTLLLLLFRDPIAGGFCQWYNAMGDVYTAGRGVVLPALEVGDGSMMALVLFSVFLGLGGGIGICAAYRLGLLPAAALVFAVISSVLGRAPDVLVMVLCALLLCSKKGRLAALSVIAVLVLVFRLPGVEDWTTAQSALLRNAVHEARYETEYTVLPEGRDPDGTLPAGDGPALVVTMEKPERLYLRGFTGAVLENGQWMPLDPALLAEQEDLLYWLNLREFDPRTQFAEAAAFAEYETNTVTVQNIGGCSAYRYVPFTMIADETLRPEDLADFAGNDGDRYDVFTTVYKGTMRLPELLTVLEETSDYRRAEAAYREFVKAHYLQIPENASAQLGAYWEESKGLDAQRAVLASLENIFPAGAENSPRYATAAVLTLRHFGIPARYAEGYIVPESAESSVTVDASCAACWAEVYHDGIGWIPMALTPGLEESTEQTDDQPETTEPEETLPQETVSQSEPEDTGGWRVRLEQLVLGGAVTAAGLLLLIMRVLHLRRRAVLKKRRDCYEQEDVRDAVSRIFADSVTLLERLGCRYENGPLSELAEPIRERLGDGCAQLFLAALSLNEKALFSSRPMTEEDRQLVRQFHDEIQNFLQNSAKWYQTLWMKFILCLY